MCAVTIVVRLFFFGCAETCKIVMHFPVGIFQMLELTDAENASVVVLRYGLLSLLSIVVLLHLRLVRGVIIAYWRS